MAKKSTVMPEQYYKGVQILPPEQRGEAYEAYLEYAFYGKEYEGGNVAIKVLLASFIDSIDVSNENYEKKLKNLNKGRTLPNRSDSEEVSPNRSDSEEVVSDSDTDTVTVTVTDTVSVSKSNDLDGAREVKPAVQEKLEEYFDYLEDLDQKPVTLKARNVITQKLVGITDIESEQIRLIDIAMENGWHNVYERGEPSAGKAKDGQQGDTKDLDSWLNAQARAAI